MFGWVQTIDTGACTIAALVDAESRMPVTTPPSLELADSKHHDVLCVQPDAKARASLEQALVGYRTVFAVNAFEGLRELNRRVFHAYVLEYWLPDWSGVQVCRHIRKSDPRVPVIICGGADRDEDRARAFRGRANAYFPRPVDLPHLTRKLRMLLELAELESKRARHEAERAIDEEIQRRIAEARARPGLAHLAVARAIERSAKSKAMVKFLKAGGTLAHFEAQWTPSFSAACARNEFTL